MLNKVLKILGKTIDGKIVVSGAFKLFDTYGVPLDFTIDTLCNHNMIIDWMQFVSDAKSAGWKDKRIESIIEYGLIDSNCYSKDDISNILSRINL